eukprot:CAMPEP_0206325904 /NCGR_PEP_ID=MMETSP0106_2-20121207/21325_1 /ASSEMBLY_ACC=CAM_ASM_000206 /TAXON_ID=81532 /ORGANISM="Acanthoeca-like sp., Strain 10tr" /LENGTH=107 /DNA_ID=CAMNT_0053758409 /DNA_START=179 /DNA_END=499 /DNA_ORIENTATION=-
MIVRRPTVATPKHKDLVLAAPDSRYGWGGICGQWGAAETPDTTRCWFQATAAHQTVTRYLRGNCSAVRVRTDDCRACCGGCNSVEACMPDEGSNLKKHVAAAVHAAS